MRNPNLLFIFVQNASFENRLKSDKDLVTTWDPPVKSDTGLGIPVCELTLADYSWSVSFMLRHERVNFKIFEAFKP